MPTRWVTRMDVDGQPLREPMKCFIEGAIIAEPGFRTVEQCVAELIEPGEVCIGHSDRRPIMKDGKLVGYVAIDYRTQRA